jgi:hypothetical protein
MAQTVQKSKGRRITSAPQGKASKSTGAGEQLWDRLGSRVQHLICLLVLLAVAIGFFAPVLFSDRSLFASDVINWRAMAEYMLRYEQETGNDALWAPNAFAGMPGYTISYDPQVPQLDDIAKLLRQVIWPVSHFFFLLLGTYLLIWYLTRSKLSGVLAAVAYGLTTFIPVLLVAGHNTKYIALTFAPWLLLAFAHAIRNPKLLSALLFAAALALNLRASHIQPTYYVSFLLGVWWIVELVGAVRGKRLAQFGRATAWLALGSVLGILMVAQPYLILAEYNEYSMRGGESAGGAEGSAGLAWDYAMSWSQGIGELTTLLVAHAFGGGSPGVGEGMYYWGPKPFTSGPHYAGALVVVLALVALWRGQRNVVLALGIGAILMTLFSLGEFFPLLNRFMFEHFPLFGIFRAPETWLGAVVLALAVLAGLGLAYLGSRRAEDEAKKAKTVYIAFGVVTGFVLLLFLTSGLYLDFERSGEIQQVEQFVAQQLQLPADNPQVAVAARQIYQEQLRAPRYDAFRSDAIRTLIFLILAGLVFVAYHRGWIPAWAMQAAMVLLVIVDLWGVGRRYLNEDVLVPSGSLEEQITAYDFDQYVLERQREAGGDGHFRVLSLESNAPTQNPRPSYFYESLGGYSAAKLQLFQDFIDHVLFDPQTGLPNRKALDLLNTRYVLAPGVLPGLNPVYQSETGIQVLENPNAVPRAFFVGQTEVIASAEETWARLLSDSFDPRQTAILPDALDFQTVPLDSGSVANVQLQDYSAHEITWLVETDAPRLLVASEIYYPAGWNAYIDGEPAPIYRADYLLRAVPAPAGSHTVVMRFEPATERTAFWISAAATLAVYGSIAVLLGTALFRRRRSGPASPVTTES